MINELFKFQNNIHNVYSQITYKTGKQSSNLNLKCKQNYQNTAFEFSYQLQYIIDGCGMGCCLLESAVDVQRLSNESALYLDRL